MKHVVKPWIRTLARLGLLVSMAGCPEMCPTEAVEREPDIELETTSVQIGQGREGTSTIGLARIGGFNGPVSLRVIETPPGLTATISPTTLATGVVQAQAVVRVAQSVAASTVPLQVRVEGTGDGVRDTVTIPVTVFSSQAPGFTLQAAPPLITMRAGQTGSSVITATRLGGYAGPISFDIIDISPEITARLQAGPGADATTATITARADAPAGRYRVLLQPQQQGLGAANINIEVVITEPLGIALAFALEDKSEMRIRRNAQDTASLRLTRRGSYTGPVTYSLENVPATLTPSLSLTTTTSDLNRMTVAVGPTATPGSTLTFRVRAKAPAEFPMPDATFDVSVFVLPDPVVGTFSLSAPNVSILQGASATSLLTVRRSGDFNSPIDLVVARVPAGHAGPAVELSPRLTAGNGIINVTSTPTTPVGTYTYRVSGNAGGGVSATTDFTVTVTAPRVASIVIRKLVNGVAQATTGETIRVGGSVSLIAELRDQNNQLLATEKVGWASANAAVARVDENGVVDGQRPGVVTVTASMLREPNLTAAIPITVTEAPSYSTAIANLTVAAGASVTTPLTITRTGGFTGAVSYTFSSENGSGLPNGMSIALTDNPVAANTTTLRVTTTSATLPGTYLLRALGTAAGAPTVSTAFSVTVTPAVPTSNVKRLILEPRFAEITAPATQQYAVQLLDANGTAIVPESGGAILYTSSTTGVASMSGGGLASGLTAGQTTITARYVLNGTPIVADSTTLTVYAAGSAGHYGSMTMSTQGNLRTIRRGESILFQIIVRNTAGVQVTSGVVPAPVVTSSNSGVIAVQSTNGPVPGYFFDMSASFSAPIGSEIRIRYDVQGAGGELVIRVVQ